MKYCAPSLIALCIRTGGVSSTVQYEALSEKVTADLKTCADTPIPPHVDTEGDYDQATAITGPALRQCKRAATAAIEQSEATKLRSNE